MSLASGVGCAPWLRRTCRICSLNGILCPLALEDVRAAAMTAARLSLTSRRFPFRNSASSFRSALCDSFAGSSRSCRLLCSISSFCTKSPMFVAGPRCFILHGDVIEKPHVVIDIHELGESLLQPLYPVLQSGSINSCEGVPACHRNRMVLCDCAKNYRDGTDDYRKCRH